MQKKILSGNKLFLYIISFLFVVGFFRGTAISGFEMFAGLRFVDQMFTLFQYCGMVYILYLIYKRGFALTLWRCMYLGFFILILISTFLSGIEVKEAISHITNILFVGAWFNVLWNNKRIVGLEAFVESLNLLQIINLITIIAFPDGMKYANSNTVMGAAGHVYFLGYDNGLIMYVLPCIFLNFYLRHQTNKGRYRVYNVLLIASIIISGSVTGILTILMVLVLYNSRYLYRILGGKKGIILAILVFLGLSSMFIQEYFSDILLLLGKGMTLSGRTDIWSWAMSYIKESPIIGYGYNTERAREVFFWRIGVSAAHSQLLDVMLQAGIIGLVIYLLLYAKSLKGCLKMFKKNRSPSWKLLFVIQAVFFFVMIVESYSSYAAYPLLFVLLRISGSYQQKNVWIRFYHGRRVDNIEKNYDKSIRVM